MLVRLKKTHMIGSVHAIRIFSFFKYTFFKISVLGHAAGFSDIYVHSNNMGDV